jgi:hypothetical protein
MEKQGYGFSWDKLWWEEAPKKTIGPLLLSLSGLAYEMWNFYITLV